MGDLAFGGKVITTRATSPASCLSMPSMSIMATAGMVPEFGPDDTKGATILGGNNFAHHSFNVACSNFYGRSHEVKDPKADVHADFKEPYVKSSPKVEGPNANAGAKEPDVKSSLKVEDIKGDADGGTQEPAADPDIRPITIVQVEAPSSLGRRSGGSISLLKRIEALFQRIFHPSVRS